MSFVDNAYHIVRSEADLYVEEVGPPEGRVLFYLHGGPGYSSYSFRDICGDDLELYHMIYADQRGTGRSYSEGSFDIDTLAGDVKGILSGLEQKSATLLAHGFGALIAIRCAVLYREVERLILVNPWVSMPVLALSLRRAAASFSGPSDENDEIFKELPAVSEIDPETELEQAFSKVPAKQLLDRLEFPNPSSRLRLEHSDAQALTGPQQMAAPEDTWSADVTDELRQVDQPIVVIVGQRDGTTYPEQAELVLKNAPRALVSYLDTGHYPWLDDPESFFLVLGEAVET
ncbi:MAG: alpha/beta hydrolase [Trueperaceae bacterium]|nr:MAG: alpha/beta hydrolase [Trueperaceae bacterium]